MERPRLVFDQRDHEAKKINFPPLVQICRIAFVLPRICALKVHHTIKVSNSLIFKNSFHWHRYASATLPLLNIYASAGFTLPEIF